MSLDSAATLDHRIEPVAKLCELDYRRWRTRLIYLEVAVHDIHSFPLTRDRMDRPATVVASPPAQVARQVSIAVLMTCFNRCALTLDALRAVYASHGLNAI